MGNPPLEEGDLMRVRSLMSTTVQSCRADQTLAHAARLLWEYDVGCVPVVDAGNRPVAMITDRDICMAAYLRGAPIAEIDVASAMSTDLFTCHLDDPLGEAERTMMTRQVRRLPVVDDEGKLVAVLSLNDIVLARKRTGLSMVKAFLRGDIVETLAAISRHRDTGDQAAE
jgi:CBS domain-containing protein